ncbi:MAG: hypothetical protein QOD30_586 [Actinomycetota bacterium]|jgi:hypothetical protein|nr:hypothetical protein [Actinomycetota bacterium]
MRRRIGIAGALLALVVVLSGVAAAVDGDSPQTTGWWSSEPGASAQDGGGFQVASVGGTAVSVAAVRFSTPSGVTSAKLSLQEATGGFVTPATSLQACVTNDQWEAANPGAMADAPKPDCSKGVPLERDEASLVWSAEVASLMPTGGGTPSLMIVPGTTPGGGSPLDPGFRVTFSEAKLAVISAPGTTAAIAPSGGVDFSSPDSAASYDPGASGGSISGIGSVTPTTAAPVTTSSTIKQGEAFSPPPLAKGASPGGGRGGKSQPWARLLFLVPLSAAIGVASVYGRRLLSERGMVEA